MCGGDADYVEQTEYEKQLLDMSDKQLAHYNELYVPLEYQQMADVARYGSQEFQQGSMNKSVNAAKMALPTQTGATAGSNPGGGNAMLQSMAQEQQSGTAGAMGAAAGLQTAKELETQGMLNLAATGQNQQNTSLGLASTMAQQQAGVAAAEAAAKQQVQNAQMGAIGSVAGGITAGYMGKMNADEKALADAVSGASTPPLSPLDYTQPISPYNYGMAYMPPGGVMLG